MTEPVGLIGVGLLGTAIAGALLRTGHSVLGFDTDASRMTALEAEGLRSAGSPVEVFDRCDRILLALPTSRIAGEVLESAESAWRDGQVVLDATTGAPADAEAFGRRLAGRGLHYLDTTVSGSSDQVRHRDAIVMVGGPREVFERVQSLLDPFARASHHLGPWGAGARMKLVTNLVLGLNRAVLAEGLAFGEALGFEPAVVLDVLRDGACYARVMDTKGEKMTKGEYTPQARLSQHLKDVRLILGEARELGSPTPLSELHRQLLETAEALGYGEADNAAIREVFRPRSAPPRT